MFQNSIGLPNNVRSFGFSTLYWMSGVSNLLSGTLNNNVRVITRQPFSGQLLLKIIKTYEIGYLMCTPAQLQLLRLIKYEEADLLSLRSIVCGGSALPQSLLSQFPVPVIPGYGMTESGTISIAGHLGSGVVLKIVDENGEKLGVGERGEICSKPRVPFLGYYANELATRETLKDGFVHSGDIGVMDANGCLHVVDRKKDIFKYNNFHINPTDVERELQDKEGIALVSVVGIPHPIYAALPAAVIVRTEGSLISEMDVHIFAKARLSHYKWLRGGVYFVEQLPMTVSGKILRREVTKRAAELYEKNPDIGFVY